jgi:hypothetical protein
LKAFWEEVKRELQAALRHARQPNPLLAVIAGIAAWAVTSTLRLVFG